MLLFFGMGVALVLLGYFIGSYFYPYGGGIFGIVFALLVWFILSIISYTAGSSILLSVSNAQEVTPEVHQQLFNVVEEMQLAANLPKTPKIYIINDAAPNAFATGIKPENSAITVTAGLLSKLNRDELQGVIAHEMSHIANRDILIMTFAGIMLGSIVLISEIFLKGLWFTGGSSVRYRSRSSSDSGQGQIIIMVVAIIFAILAPIAAQLLYFAISRRREYLADANGARLTRFPEGLASALEKISSTDLDLKSANKVTAPMFIVNPLKKKGMKLSDLTSTHPPTSERIRILRSMAGGVNYINYQNAFNQVKGKNSVLIPAAALADSTKIDVRKASSEIKSHDNVKEKRSLGDLMMTVNKYAFIVCACGLKMKVPPDYKEKSIT
ncbi:MAG: M48 family metallopeptidase, partial [Ignavibacteriaceae bacterium]